MKSLIYGVVIGVTLIGAAQANGGSGDEWVLGSGVGVTKASSKGLRTPLGSDEWVLGSGVGITATYIDVGDSPAGRETQIKYKDWFTPGPAGYISMYLGPPRVQGHLGYSFQFKDENDYSSTHQTELTLQTAIPYKGGLMTFRGGAVSVVSNRSSVLRSNGLVMVIGLESPKGFYVEGVYSKFLRAKYENVKYSVNEDSFSIRLGWMWTSLFYN